MHSKRRQLKLASPLLLGALQMTDTSTHPTDLITGAVLPTDSVAKLSANPTPTEALAALDQEFKTRAVELLRLVETGGLPAIKIDDPNADQTVQEYKQRFAQEAAPTAKREVDPVTGATLTLFQDAKDNHIQGISIDDPDGGHHRYLFNGRGQMNEGSSFDKTGQGVAVDHIKWTVDSVKRVDAAGETTVQNYDGDVLLRIHNHN